MVMNIKMSGVGRGSNFLVNFMVKALLHLIEL
jgi:hypothetical protein